MRENCPGLVAGDRPPFLPAALKIAALNGDQVRLTFIGHSTFMIESPEGVRIATDYNDYLRPPVLPDIATMNHAHDTHFSDHPNPAIQYVLRGWGPSPEEPAIWDLKYRDVRVRNVPTNIRDWTGGTERYGNSIFVFEIANLCIAPSRPSASHAHPAAAQRDRPRRRGDGAGRRQLHARSRRHDGSSHRAESADHHPDAFFRLGDAGALSRAGGPAMAGRALGSPDPGGFKNDAAGKPEGSGADGILNMSAAGMLVAD